VVECQNRFIPINLLITGTEENEKGVDCELRINKNQNKAGRLNRQKKWKERRENEMERGEETGDRKHAIGRYTN
jgi:ATP sulfurylase